MTNTTYILEADFGAGYTRTLKYDFSEEKFTDHGDSREFTTNFDEALAVFQTQPEGAKEYRLVKSVFNEETGDNKNTILQAS